MRCFQAQSVQYLTLEFARDPQQAKRCSSTLTESRQLSPIMKVRRKLEKANKETLNLP